MDSEGGRSCCRFELFGLVAGADYEQRIDIVGRDDLGTPQVSGADIFSGAPGSSRPTQNWFL